MNRFPLGVLAATLPGFSPRVTTIVCVTPSRTTLSVALLPGSISEIVRLRFSPPVITLPFTDSITSPDFNPAFSAGELAVPHRPPERRCHRAG